MAVKNRLEEDKFVLDYITTLYQKRQKKEDIIKENIEEQKYFFLERAEKLENSFYEAFFEHSIENAVADAYEIFLETKTEYNYFEQQLKQLDEEKGRRFLKLVAIYHSIRLSRIKRRKLRWREMRRNLYFVLELNEKEKKLAEVLYCCAKSGESCFSDLFAKTTARYVFNSRILSPFSLAFIENFCYNSFNSFMSSFTKYLSVNVRLKRATS